MSIFSGFPFSGTTTRLCCPRGHERSTKIPNTPRRQIDRPIALSSHLFQPARFASLRNIWQAQDIPHESHTRVLWRIWLCLKTKKKKYPRNEHNIKEYTRIHTRFPNKGIPKWFQTMRSKKNIWKKNLSLFMKVLSVRFLFYCCFKKKEDNGNKRSNLKELF